MFTPVPQVTDDGAIEAHGVRAVAERPAERAVGVGRDGSIAQKQMRKHQASIDQCTAAATKRNARATGTLELSILIGDKKVAHADALGGPDPRRRAQRVPAEGRRALDLLARPHPLHLADLTFLLPLRDNPPLSSTGCA